MVWILCLVNMRKQRRRNKVLVSQNLFVWSWLCETRTFLEAGGAKYLLETLCKLFAYSTLFNYHAGKWWAVFREFYTHIHLDLEDGSKRSRVIGLQLCFGFLLKLLKWNFHSISFDDLPNPLYKKAEQVLRKAYQNLFYHYNITVS